MENLNANTIALQGKHLIEASAGTGKTHNITRIFLRLLLERALPIEQILVMTFTKDATEEIRGRIDDFIRESLHNWDSLILSDDYFKTLNANLASKQISSREVKARLSQALLYIDEAAIFTIHGFCKRVLNQYAFASGISFSAQMETNTQDITLEACQDWYRVLALTSQNNSENNSQAFKLLTQFWPEPNAFISQFSKALSTQNQLNVQDPENIRIEFKGQVEQAISSLKAHDVTLTAALIDVKKGAEREKRQQELAQLLNWLAAVASNVEGEHGKMPDAFIDGRRYGRSKFKSELVEIFNAVNAVKKQYPALATKVNRAQALLVVRQGIYHIRGEISRKKLQANVMGFDDLITTLNHCLADEPEPILANSIFSQFPVALIDEFQDTDPQQFSILKAIYYHQPNAALYMIGDPKQAIYGFRGGDIFAYLSARNDCDYQWLMDTNWRSSAAMITGYNRLFYGNNLSQDAVDVFGYQIPYLPVKASVKAQDKVFNDSQYNALQFIHFNLDEKSKDGKAKAVKQSYRTTMAAWCADEIVRLLACPNLDIASGDIALLVRDGAEAADIKLALSERGLASVFMSNRANLLQSRETQHLLQVLQGILFLENDRLYTAALASPLMGFEQGKLLQLQHDEQQWQQLKVSFEKLRNEWQFKGFISMALQLMHQHFHIDFSGNDNDSNSNNSNADRVLTNLLHLFELLQSASQLHRQPQELLFWFEQQSQIDNPDVEAELRLESDENLLRIITQHGSKGMEYPVVFVPFATRHKDPLKFGNRNVSFIEYHDENGVLQQSLDGSQDARARMASEAYAETIRLLYVAITRAEKRCYLLSTGFDAYEKSPLGKALKWSSDTDIVTSLQQLVDDNPEQITLEVLENYLVNSQFAENIVSENVLAGKAQVHVASFAGKIERDWWLSSFSALSKNLRHNGVSGPDRDNQEASAAQASEHDNGQLIQGRALRFTLTKGAKTGNLLHDILEQTNFCAPDWQKSCHWPLIKYGAIVSEQADETQRTSQHLSIEQQGEQQLIQWLDEILQTPLSPNTDLSLAQLSLPETLRETEFYYPMRSASSSALTKLLTEHRNTDLGGNESSSRYMQRVHLPSYHQLKGMMHGFIDLIFQTDGKFYVCDYKSSHLGDAYRDYNDVAMRDNIEKNHYDLQYLIYALALHRHLKYSMANYDPAQHFGGVYYLYLRGMSSESQHQGCGVYHREITGDELSQLDDIFAGESRHA
ncbi:MAG: exodeoxyribonuclease V subunit beta [Cognaticolwellia sp.]